MCSSVGVNPAHREPYRANTLVEIITGSAIHSTELLNLPSRRRRDRRRTFLALPSSASEYPHLQARGNQWKRRASPMDGGSDSSLVGCLARSACPNGRELA